MDRQSIESITRRLVSHFNPRRVILFGSHARGAAGKDSDLDLYLEMETDLRPPERAVAVSALFGLRTWPLDVLVYTPEEAARLRNAPGSFLARIESEGEVLYEQR